VVGGVTVTVMVARTVLVLTDTVSTRRAYFGSDLRADALLLGCLLGIAHHAGWTASMAPHLRRLAWPAVAVLAVAVVAAPSPFDEIGPVAYVPVDVASFIVIGAVVAVPQRWAALSWPPLVRVGVLSYGVYLWHLPLMFVFGMAPLTRLLVAIPAAIAIAAISHRVVEVPALRWKRRFEPANAPQPVGVVAA
jgi:peptidoglycan/LPS O-acetylase OafA/YrhL